MGLAELAQLAVSVGSLASVLLAGRRLPGGQPRFPVAPWLLLFAAHGLFLAYVVASDQPGFLLLNVGMMVAALLNLRASGQFPQWWPLRLTPRTRGGTVGVSRERHPGGPHADRDQAASTAPDHPRRS
jgi:hypothetical protein